MNKELALYIYGELKERKGEFLEQWTNEYNIDEYANLYYKDMLEQYEYCEENEVDVSSIEINLEEFREDDLDEEFELMERQASEIEYILECKLRDIILA